MNPDEVRERWAERSGAYSPSYYAYRGPDETSDMILDMLDSFVGRDAAVVELGCSSGRHLAHLHDHGYDRLHGVEINDEAFEVMGEAYPDLAAAGTFYNDDIANVVGRFDDGRFDAVFSVETLQHIHPDDEAVFDELARVTADLLVTVENEDRDERADPPDVESDGEDATDDTAGTDDGDATVHRGVNYVREEVPLYYRDWNAVFTERGFTEVESRPTKRDTLRAFRSADA